MCLDDENSRVITYVHIAANIKVFEPCFRLIVCSVAIFSTENYFLWNSFSKKNHGASFREPRVFGLRWGDRSKDDYFIIPN